MPGRPRRAFQRGTVPVRVDGCCLIARLQELEQRLVRVCGQPHRVVGQDEFAQCLAEECSLGSHRHAAIARGFRVGVGIECGIIDRAAARPEAGAADLVRIGLVRHRVGQMRHAAGMLRCPAAGEARHRKIKAAPEEMHRARLAEKAGPELLEYAIAVHQDLVKPAHRIRVIRCVLRILRKRDRVGDFVRYLVNGDVDSEVFQIGHDRRVEARDRLTGQRESPLGAVAGRDAERVIDEIEVDLERAVAVGDRRGRQPARRDVERDVPGVIEPGRLRQPDLAGDLGEELQHRAAVAPRRDWQVRPAGLLCVGHRKPQGCADRRPCGISRKWRK